MYNMRQIVQVDFHMILLKQPNLPNFNTFKRALYNQPEMTIGSLKTVLYPHSQILL